MQKILILTKDKKMLFDSTWESMIVDNSLIVEESDDTLVIVLNNNYKPEWDVEVKSDWEWGLLYTIIEDDLIN